ncbi:Ribosomal protein S11, partial [human gut metagenome]
VTLTDTQGNALSWASAGGLGFRGSEIYSICSTDGG